MTGRQASARQDAAVRDRRVRRRSRQVRLGSPTVLLTLLAAAVGVSVAGNQPSLAAATPTALSPRVTGIVEIVRQSSSDAVSPKSVNAGCPSGKQIVGGGARLLGSRQVTLTRVQPYVPGTDPNNPYGYGYRASAARAVTLVDHSWSLEVVAVCAYMDGLHIVSRHTSGASTSVQAIDAACPDGERVLGTGARVLDVGTDADIDHGLGLQVARVDTAGGLTRAQAHELPGGYASDWQIAAFAVCAPEPFGYLVRSVSAGTGEWGDPTQTWRTSAGTCPVFNHSPDGRLNIETYPRRPVGVGGSVDSTAPGNVTLHTLGLSTVQLGDRRTRQAWGQANENPSTTMDWSLLVRFICLPEL